MVRRLAAFSVIAFVASSTLVAQPRTLEVETVRGQPVIDKTTQTEDVKFRNDRHDRMTVPVRLSGTGPYRFLVDTGADRTAISHDVARKLNLVAGEKASLHSLGGVSSVSTAIVPNLQLTRRAVRVVDAPLLDSSLMGADGILGVDALRSQRILFDFEANTMSIVPSASAGLERDRNSIVVTASRRNGRLIVTQAKANHRPVTVVLDTGAEVSIGNTALRRQLLGDRPVDPARLTDLQSVTGQEIVGEHVIVDKVEMGGVTFKKLAIVFIDAHTFKQLKLHKKPTLLLGMNAMRAFKKMSIDFANRKFRFVLPEQSALDIQMAESHWPGSI